MRRRELLATAGLALAGLAGCQDGGQASTAEPGRTATPDGGYDVFVGGYEQQHGLVVTASSGGYELIRPSTQFLVVHVAVAGNAPPTDEFGVHVLAGSFQSFRDDSLVRVTDGDEQFYSAERGSGILIFPLPVFDEPHDITLRWPDGEDTAPDGISELAASDPPTMSARIGVDREYAGEGAPTFGVQIRNDGDRPGRFLGALVREGPGDAVVGLGRLSLPLGPGEQRQISIPDRWSTTPASDAVGDDAVDVTYRVSWAGGETTAPVRLV